MPRNKDLKRLVRDRKKKTGESYTTARSQILQDSKPKKSKTSPSRPGGTSGTKRGEQGNASSGATASQPTGKDYATIAGMSDDAVARKTERSWAQWVDTLDAAGAFDWPHREIARHLHQELGIGSWWAQMVTVGYERIKGLREKNQRRGGAYEINKSKTVGVALETLYAAFGASKRRHWLGDAEVKVRKATRLKSMRLIWPDGTPLEVYFWKKGPQKSQVQLQHRKLASKRQAEEMRSYWSERLAALAAMLRPEAT